jgi:hypothetical protein
VAYDARDGVWIVSWLGAHFSGGGVVDVMVSRSTDGGLTWGAPVTIAATGVFYGSARVIHSLCCPVGGRPALPAKEPI